MVMPSPGMSAVPRHVYFRCGLGDIMRLGGFVFGKGIVFFIIFRARYDKAWCPSAVVWRVGGADGIE